jgi:hypothetical protein
VQINNETRTPPPRQRRLARATFLIPLIWAAIVITVTAGIIGMYGPAAAKLDARVWAESAVSHYVKALCIAEAASTTSYVHMLAIMSSLGFALDNAVCAPDGAAEPQIDSQEQNPTGSDHFLILDSTILTPPGWDTWLHALPIVERVDSQLDRDVAAVSAQERSLPTLWRKVTNPFLSPLRNSSPIKLIATDPALSHDHAVRLALDMGLPLADPTCETATKRGAFPEWRPIRQADTFAAQRARVVAPTFSAPRDWKSQIEATQEFSIDA